MFMHAREGSVVAGLLLAIGIVGPAMADPIGDNFVSGVVTAVPSGSPVFGARVEPVGVLDFSGRPIFDDTGANGSYVLFSVPAGEQVLRVTGNCLDTTDEPVTVTSIDFDDPSTFGVERDIAVVNRSRSGVGDCLPYAHEPPFSTQFWQRLVLNHRATLANKKPFSISLPFAVRFGGLNYRRVWATANGWIGFNKPAASCDQLTSASAPAASIFALAQCGETTEVKYDVLGQKPHRVMVLRWNLVTPGTTLRSDVAIRLFEDDPAVIGVSYISLGGTTDGSNAFIGFSTKSGNVFTLGDHQAVVKNASSLIFRPGL
jgi:hypothetical protein